MLLSLNLPGWVGVVAPPELRRGGGSKVRGETGTENNKMSGKPENLIFPFLQKDFQSCPKGSL